MKKLFTLLLFLCLGMLQYSMAQVEKIVTTTIPFQVNCTSSQNNPCKSGSTVCYKSDENLTPTSCEFIKTASSVCLGRSWSASYGMPTVDAYGNLKMSSSPGQVFNIGTQPFCKGQGIFTSFTFKKGYKYDIILTTMMNTGNVTFNLQASTGGTANTTNTCGSIQNPQGYIPTNNMQFFNKVSSAPITYTMVADNNFTKFWINSDNGDKVIVGNPPTDHCSLISVEIKETPPILGNKVCCDQTIPNTLPDWPYSANPVDQDAGTTITTFTGTQISYKWEVYNDAQGNWNAVTPETVASSYSPINLHRTAKLRRIAYVNVPLSSGPYHWATAPSNVITIAPQPILNNRICCPLTAYIKSNTPTGILTSDDNYTMSGVLGNPIYQWQYSYDQTTWVNIPNTNYANYEPKYLVRETYFRRVVSTKMQPDGYPSNVVFINVRSCTQPSIDEGNTICGDQYYYNLPEGSGSVTPIKLFGSRWEPTGHGTFDYEWQVSYDQGASWGVLNEKKKDQTYGDRKWDIEPPAIHYSGLYYAIKEVWYKRIEWRAYDSWDCGPLNIHPCGNQWHEKGHSNIVKVYLSTHPDPNELSIVGVSNINDRSISCGITSFQLGLAGTPNLYAMLYRAEWSVVDNIDWKISSGGVWGVEVLPWVTNTTGLTHAKIRAKLYGWDGRIVEKDFVVTSPAIPVITLDKTGPLNICKGVGTSVKGTGSGGQGALQLSHTTTLNGITTSTIGNEYTVSIPAAQTNYSPQQLTITVTDANGCSSSKAITINPDGEGWIHDQPWIAGGTHLPAIGDNTGNGNTYANIVAEQRGNIYYVGSDGKLQPTYNTLNTYQWDEANLQWRNFSFPKYDGLPLNPPTITDAAGPLAVSEDPITHKRRIYYVTTLGSISYIESKGGYVDEFTYVDDNATNGTTTNWNSSVGLLSVTDAIGSITPLNFSARSIIYKHANGNLMFISLDSPLPITPATITNPTKGHNYIVTASNRLIYVDANNNIKVLDISNSFADITPVGLNGVYAGTNSSLVYSDTKQYLFFVAGRTSSDAHFGKIGLYDFSTNQLHYTDDVINTAAPAFFKAPSLTINKVTGVCYAGGASTSPDGATDYEVYQCFVDNGQLLVRRLNSKDSPSLNDGYGGISVVSERKLFTDYNLFFVSAYSNKIHMDYYFSGGCGPGITKMAFDPDHVYGTVSEEKESVTTEASIVPNPNKGDFQVYYNQQKEAEIEILVYSALGELVHQSNKGIVPAGNNVFVVENTHFTSGLYFVKIVENGTLKYTGKMMVQK